MRIAPGNAVRNRARFDKRQSAIFNLYQGRLNHDGRLSGQETFPHGRLHANMLRMVLVRLLILLSLASCEFPPNTVFMLPDASPGLDAMEISCVLPMTISDGYSEILFTVSRDTSFNTACVSSDTMDAVRLSLNVLRPTGLTILAVKTGVGDVCISPTDSAFDDITFSVNILYRLRLIGMSPTDSILISGRLCKFLTIN